MAKKKLATKKANAPDKTRDESIGFGLVGVASALDNIASELQPIYKLDDTNDRLNDLAVSIDLLAKAQMLGVIATHGSPEDREKAVESCKQWIQFDAS